MVHALGHCPALGLILAISLAGCSRTGRTGSAPPPTAEYLEAYDRAARLEREGHPEEAAAVYGEAAERASRPRTRWQAAYRQARELEVAGDRAEALRMYLAIAEGDPAGEMAPRSAYYAARMAHEDGDDETAIARLLQVIETYPDDGLAPQAVRRLVQWLEDRGEEPRAVALLTDLEPRLRGTDVGDNLLYQLALLAADRGEREEALALFERQVDLYPFPRSTLYDDALWCAGNLALEMGQPERAIGYLAALVARRERSLAIPASYYTEWTDDAQLLIGRIRLEQLDDPAGAARAFEELVTFPDSTLADDGLWWASRVYLGQGERGRSCEALRRLVEGFSFSNYLRRARAAFAEQGCGGR